MAGLASAPAFAATITRGPFLQQTTPTSSLMVVHTDTPATVEARDPAGNVLARGEPAREHHLRLEGLRPASNVTYQLFLDGTPVGQAATFRTPAIPGTEQAQHAVLGVIGDMGSGGKNERANVQQLKARGVEAVLTVGDNAYPSGAPGDWDPKLFQPFAPLLSQSTLWPALGDHEYETPRATGYLDAFVLPEGPEGERYYSFDWGDIHVAVLDSNCVDPTGGVIICEPGKMVAWLTADLAASQAPWKLVTIHRPAVASGRYGPSEPVTKALMPLFEKAGVDLVLQGHNHVYERSWPMRGGRVIQKSYARSGAPVYMTTGGGGDWVYESTGTPPDWSVVRRTEFHHLVLTLDTGSLRVDAVRPDGSLFDTFTLTKDVPPPTQQPAPGAPAISEAPKHSGPTAPPQQSPSTPSQPVVDDYSEEQSPTGCSSAPGVGLGLPLLGLVLAGYLRRRRRP
jgi:acid phosphatase type 7